MTDRSALPREKDGGGGEGELANQERSDVQAVDLQHQLDRLEGELAEARRELCKESPQDFNNDPNSSELLKAEEERELELTELREALGAEIERLASSKSVSNWQLADRLRALANKEEG